MAHGCMARQKQDKLEVRMWIVFQDRSYCPGTQRHKLPVAVHGYYHCHRNAKAHSNAKHDADTLPPKLSPLDFLLVK
jgi:hypothetical protein